MKARAFLRGQIEWHVQPFSQLPQNAMTPCGTIPFLLLLGMIFAQTLRACREGKHFSPGIMLLDRPPNALKTSTG
jgi:hypothetical protein